MKVAWFVFVLVAVLVGVYPLAYIITDMSGGLLSTKPPELLNDQVWRLAFYCHILPGGMALLAGWSQFITTFRNKYLSLHRWLGRVYVSAVLISGSAGLYLAWFATGGMISILGFGMLALLWLITTGRAYQLIRTGRSAQHHQWMIRSYALCFAAVTLRLWLPFLDNSIGLDFFVAYRLVAWLCWVPNLMVGEWMVWNLRSGSHTVNARA